MEPESFRHKNFETEHYSIALQGGGAKGVCYVGMAKAILEDSIPVKSLLCSSIGCLCGLMMACGVKYENALSIIENNFSVMTKDLTFPTKEGR